MAEKNDGEVTDRAYFNIFSYHLTLAVGLVQPLRADKSKDRNGRSSSIHRQWPLLQPRGERVKYTNHLAEAYQLGKPC